PKVIANRRRRVVQVDPDVPHPRRGQPAYVSFEARLVVDAQHGFRNILGEAAKPRSGTRRQDERFANSHCSCMRTSSNKLRKLPENGLYRESGSARHSTGNSRTVRPNLRALMSVSASNMKPSIFAAENRRSAACAVNSLKPHCVSE